MCGDLLVNECDDGSVGGDHNDQGQEEGEEEDKQEVQVLLTVGVSWEGPPA